MSKSKEKIAELFGQYKFLGTRGPTNAKFFSFPCKGCGKERPLPATDIINKKRTHCRLCRNKIKRENAINNKTYYNGQKIINCKKCNVLLNENNSTKYTFKLHSALIALCTECQREKSRYYYQKGDLEKRQVRQKRYRNREFSKMLILSAKRWSKERGQEFQIDEEWIHMKIREQNHKCFWFNVEFVFEFNERHPLKPSLDRLDRSKGYTKENTVIACYAANFGRNETDVIVWQDFIQSIRFQNSSNQFNES